MQQYDEDIVSHLQYDLQQREQMIKQLEQIIKNEQANSQKYLKWLQKIIPKTNQITDTIVDNYIQIVNNYIELIKTQKKKIDMLENSQVNVRYRGNQEIIMIDKQVQTVDKKLDQEVERLTQENYQLRYQCRIKDMSIQELQDRLDQLQ